MNPSPAPSVSFQLESWASYFDDPARPGLWLEHYEELAADTTDPMSPDGAFYGFCEAQGALQLLTARRAGRMIGYVIVVVKRHPHYSTLCGFEDSYFLTKSERKGGVGVMMFAKALEFLRRRGVKKAFFMNKLAEGLDCGKIFSRMGFVETDRVWMKRLQSKGTS